MSAPHEPALDVRHWELAEKLRSAPPRPSDELRERVRALAASEPTPARHRLVPSRRLVFALAPLALVLAGGAAVGLHSSAGDRDRTPQFSAFPKERPLPARGGVVQGKALSALQSETAARSRAATFAPDGTRRLQDYQAQLRVRVRSLDRLGDATQQAMRTTRSLGGYVVVADYGAPTRRNGESLLVVRVPVGRIQQAIFRFSELGAIVSQRIRIQDLQAGFNRLERRILALRQRIVRLQARIADRGTTAEERARLRVQLLAARQDLSAALQSRETTLRRGRLARITLTLTTHGETAAAPSKPGYVERTLGDALEVVGKVLVWALFGLIVATPFLLLALLAWLGERARRRRADDRLLERAST